MFMQEEDNVDKLDERLTLIGLYLAAMISMCELF